MQRRVFTREFKLETARLVLDGRVAVSQAPRDLDVAKSVLPVALRNATPAFVLALADAGWRCRGV